MRIETPRLVITDFTPDMAQAVHLGSLDADTRRFLPDEVFETEAVAAEVISNLIDCYTGDEGPFVHPYLLSDGAYAGYVQLVRLESGWEVGYHTVAAHTGRGYATEALQAFLPVMLRRMNISEVFGVCDAENAASIRVLEKCGFRRVFAGDAPYQGSVRPVVRLLYTL